MRYFFTIFSIILVIGGIFFCILIEIFKFIFLDINRESFNYFLYILIKNNLLISTFISSIGIILFFRKTKIWYYLIFCFVSIFFYLFYNNNKLPSPDTNFEPLPINFSNKILVKDVYNLMKSKGFNMVGVEIEKYDEDKNETYILNYEQLLKEREFPYKFIKYSNMGYKEEVYIEIDFFKSLREERDIPLEENEITGIAHYIKNCQYAEDCGKKDYKILKDIFEKHFLHFKSQFQSNPDFVGYTEFIKNRMAVNFGENSKLINLHKDDFIWYSWEMGRNEKMGKNKKFSYSVSLRGESDKETSNLINNNITVTVNPVVLISYSKF